MSSPENPPSPVPFRGSGPFLEIAPPLSLPLRHFAFSAIAFWVFAAAFLWGSGRFLGFDFQARWVLGLVHTLTLGWVGMTILGALSQMIPVHGETPLKLPRVLAAAWWLFAAGIAGFVGLLWAGSELYWAPAALLVVAVILYLFVLGRTLAASKKLDWTAVHLACALGYLAALAALGVLLAYDRQRGVIFRDPGGALIAHVHLALVGWVSLSILGASYRMVSSIALARMESNIPGRLALGLANTGLIGLAVDSLFFGHRLLRLWACLLAAAFLCFASQLRPYFRGAEKKTSPSMAFVLLAFLGGAAWTALGLALAFGWIADTTENRAAYVLAALLGWVTPYIFAQIHKIVPFLVWLHVYSPREWRPPIQVPTIDDISSRRLVWAELAFLAPGIYCGIGGFLIESPGLLRASGLFLLAAATFYAINTAMTFSHLFRRDSRWSAPPGRPTRCLAVALRHSDSVMTNNGQLHREFRAIQFSAAARYALEGMAYLARRGEFVLADEVARRRGLPAGFLAKIFQRLASRGFLTARRGPGGGYALARDARRIRVLDIVSAVGEPALSERRCLLGAGYCGQGRPCPLHRTALRAEAAVRRALEALLLSELAAAGAGRMAVTLRSKDLGRIRTKLSGYPASN